MIRSPSGGSRAVRQLIAAALVATPLAAQQPVGRDTARLRDLVVTASKVPEPRSTVPFATTVINGDDLRARGVRYVLDALREVPGLAIVQTGGYGSVASAFLRGGESDDVKVLLDGVPLNLPGGSYNFANLTTDDIDRIEVVRGPASVLYGADAMSGVIQLFTRHADSAGVHGDVAMQGGSFGTGNAAANLAGAARTWSFDVTGSRAANDGFYDFNNRYRDAVGTAHAGWHSGGTALAFIVRSGDARANFPTDGSGNPVDHNQFSTEKNLQLSLQASRALTSNMALHVTGYGSRLDEGYRNRSDTPADTSGFDFVDDRTGITWRRGADARVDWTLPHATTSVGLGLEHETDHEFDAGESNFGVGTTFDTARFAAHRTTRDGYLQLIADPVRSLMIQAGTRVDDNSAFGAFATWRIGASVAVVPAVRVWAAAGTAFKAPTFSQQFAQSAFEVGDPNLRPERSANQEVGMRADLLRHRLRVGTTAFWQRFRDLIQYVTAAPGAPTYVNLGGANARGIEATLEVTPLRALRLSAHWTWLHTEVSDTGAASSLSVEEGAPLIRRPAQSGGIFAAYTIGRISASIAGTRVGSRDDVDYSGFPGERVILPAYTTWDFALDAPIRQAAGHSPGINLTLRAENLLDATYAQVVGFPGRGRTVLGGARLSF